MPNGNTDSGGRRLGVTPALATACVVLASLWCGSNDHLQAPGDATDAGDVGDGSPPRSDGGGGRIGESAIDAPLTTIGDASSPVGPLEAGALPPPPPPPPPPGSSAVLTFRNDNFRTGANLAEHQLDVATVRARGMALKFSNNVDSEVNAQPLYVPGLVVNGKARDVVFVTTLNNTVYAFDANEAMAPMVATKLWQVTLTDPENAAARPLARGIYSTPVIDLASNTMFVVHSTRNIRHDSGKLTPAETAALDVEFFLVALDIRTGAQLRFKKIAGGYPRMDGSTVAFEARNHWCRPALLLGGGSLYVACGMRSDESTTMYYGWVFRYDAATFAPQGTFCTAPEVNLPGDGASIWQSGSGPAADPDGNIYFITGNGPADFAHHSYGDALVKLSTSNGGLAFAGAFTSEGPDGKLERHDVDFGSGGALVLPDAPLVFGAGKTGIGYVLARDGMTKQQQFPAAVNQYDPTAPVDVFWAGGPHMHGTPAYWRGPTAGAAYLYTWGEQDYLRRHVLDLSTNMFDPARAVAGKVLALRNTMPGGALSISADGTRAGSGIVWATLPGLAAPPDPRSDARLLAQDAETLDVIWETTFPSLAKWVPPTVADGKVFIATGAGKFLMYELGPTK
jgi:outer membrane protein assembly factor BamB